MKKAQQLILSANLCLIVALALSACSPATQTNLPVTQTNVPAYPNFTPTPAPEMTLTPSPTPWPVYTPIPNSTFVVTEFSQQVTNPVPVALFLDDSTIHFHCLESPKCFPDIDLGNLVRKINGTNQYPLSLLSAYYGGDSIIYLHIGGSVWDYLVKINLQKGQVQYLNINISSLSSRPDFLPMFLPGEMKMIHGKIVVGTVDGKLGIVQDDFSLKTIDLESPIQDFIEATGSKVAVVGYESTLQNGKTQENIFLVDVTSGEIEEKIFNGPQAGGLTVTIDKDLHYLYWVSSDNLAQRPPSENPILHRFDMQTQKDVLAVPISVSEAYAYTTLTASRFQYQGLWYYSRRCPCEGLAPAILMNMSSLKPVVNPSVDTFMIAPFGDNFLIGTNSRVLVMSSNGTVINTYTLPEEWTKRNYLLLEYRK